MRYHENIQKCQISLKKKENYFVVSLEWKEGIWESGMTGGKIYPVDGRLVEVAWGSGVPIKIYSDMNEVLEMMRFRYKVEPIVV